MDSLLEAGRFSEAAALGREIVTRRRAAVAGASSLVHTTWDPLLVACRAAVGAGNPRCVDWAVDVLRSVDESSDDDGAVDDVRPSLVQLAQLLKSVHRWTEAEAAYRRVLAIDERVAGRVSQDAANTLTRLGEFFRVDVGDLIRARTFFDEALAIREELFGRDSFQAARSLHNMAILVADLEGYEEALVIDERAVAIIEQTLPADDLRLATAKDFLGVLRRGLGDYVGARDLHQHGLVVREAQLGPESVAVANSLTNLSPVLADLGDEAGALAAAERALGIYDRVLANHPNGAEAASHLADIHAAAGRFEAAAMASQRSLAILRANRPDDHPDLGDALQKVAHLDLLVGRADAAEPLFLEALALLADDPQKHSRALADTLEGLGRIKLLQGAPDEAAGPLERALELRLARFGDRHPTVAQAMGLLAEQRRASGDDSGALNLALRAETIGRDHLTLMMGAQTDHQALRYAATRVSGLDIGLALEAEHRLKGETRRVWSALIDSRALVLDEMTRRQKVAALGPGTALGAELADAREDLARLTLRSLRGELTAPLADRLRRAAVDVDRLEQAMAVVSVPEDLATAEVAAVTEVGATAGASLVHVATRLSSGTALLAYAAYSVGGGGPERERRYMGFVLASADAEPIAVDVGAADPIDRLVQEWKQLNGGSRPLLGRRTAFERVLEVGDELRRRVWDPVAPHLSGTSEVVIVPDGSLHLINFAGLPTTSGHFLIDDDRLLHYLSAERDLGEGVETRVLTDLLAVGGPDFDAVPVLAPTAERGSGSGLFRDAAPTCGEALHFDPLPGSRDEVTSIAADWREQHGAGRARLLVGAAASERAVKSLSDPPDVLHLATHAFFLDKDCVDSTQPYSSLLMSGLALTGANDLLTSVGTDDARPDDGVLTGVEIASLDLSRTRLVVLSACDTGGGTIQDGEGVLGLRRAFRSAGAGTLVMSLWRVGDTTAREWMDRFYSHLLDGVSTAEAVRDASRDLLKRLREDGLAPDPSVWAAFVAAGASR